MKKNKSGKKINCIKFIYSEEIFTNIDNATEDDLRKIFNKKYFNYIKKIEDKNLRQII